MSVTRVDVPEGFGDRVRSAVFWRSGSQIASQMVTWTATIMVVRILEPQDYGLFAMTQVILVLLNFLNGYSFASSLIQAEEIDEKRIGQVFGLLILLNGALAAIQLISAPLVADYFRQPVIADMLRVQSLLYLATPLIALNSALLARSLDFRNQAISNLAGAFTGAITALICARSGLGLWTLVYAPLAIAWVRLKARAAFSSSAVSCCSANYSGLFRARLTSFLPGAISILMISGSIQRPCSSP
jgi:O-antigen/teichoic acid export membrane protein